ncbi:MAG: cobalamin-binding protein [Cellvibrionaceae bacterium]
MRKFVSAIMAVLCSLSASMLSAAAVSVVDDLGNRVNLERPAQRIVALAPHIVEMVYAVGSGEQLVGAVNYSDYPEAAKALPRVGTYKAFSAEAILRLNPDLVLAWHSGNGAQRVAPVQALGIPIYFSEPRSLEDIGKALEKIAVLSGRESPEKARLAFEQELSLLRSQYAHQSEVSVFYQVWNRPLQTLNGDHLISDVIRLCGGRNVFSEAKTLAPQISVESILRLNPQVIVASGMGEARPEWLDEWSRWPSLTAVKNAQLRFIPPDIIQRHTPRVLKGARLMCEHLQQARDVY